MRIPATASQIAAAVETATALCPDLHPALASEITQAGLTTDEMKERILSEMANTSGRPDEDFDLVADMRQRVRAA